MIIGIDLGTTYSAAAYLDQNGQPQMIPNREGENTTPSVVMFENGDENSVVVGSQAKECAGIDPYNVVQFIKRESGNQSWNYESDSGKVFKMEEISALILKRIVADCEAALGEKIEGAVITVPAYFGDAERTATENAAKIAGINVLGLINEPTAAALAFGMSRNNEGSTIMFYDLGGGTFDVTILRIEDGFFKVLATHGDKNLGGFNFDNAIMNYANQKIKDELKIDPIYDDELQQDLRLKSEQAKRALSAKNTASFVVGTQGKRLKIDLTREKFEELIYPLIANTEASIDIALEDAGLKPSEINKVILVGGSTRIPAVQKFVADKMKIAPSCEVHPDYAVAMGAAHYAAELQKNPGANLTDDHTEKPGQATSPEQPPMIQDVTSHGFGIVAWNPETRTDENAIIIKRNTTIPVKESQTFYTSVENQQQLHLVLTEGDETDLQYVTQIGETMINIVNCLPRQYPITVEIAVDKNGVVHAYAYEGSDKQVYLGELEVKRKNSMSDEELNEKERQMMMINPD